ncbi:tyrosine-type recombinase/integrase [Acinetobacter baumannii]|uniref:tyrosine-type recombinase/integrase n=1 Tax=Acinetobacter baumannii TaxID=470 RepID=UPI0013BE538E|nr:integrase arm-type DNA-binding domain-containing protein [Acinetobacter baumannii]NDX18370.1 tyrosine-type recombinase/integrase [Acinetobacter baumannii]NDX36579.1 tyrosine-type recombinase/integrase [Acinetobacter baumannii]
MARKIVPLTDSKCTGAKPLEKDYSLYDGQGLILFVRKSGTKVWRYKYKRANGKDGLMTLGNFPALSLKAARDKRRELEELLANGVDPIDHIEQQKARLDDSYCFEAVAREWHKAYDSTGRWAPETAARALKNLEEYVFPRIGRQYIDTLKPKDLIQIIKAIEELGFTEVVKKTRQRLISIFAFAMSKGLIENNPAYGLQDIFVLTKKTKHHPQLPLEKLPELQSKLAADTGYPLTRLCVEFALHTFARSSEIRFARWDEFDFDKAIWTIPAERESVPGYKYSHRGAKMKTPHLIPLSKQALAIIKEIHKYSGHTQNVFPKNGDPHGFMSETTINKTLRRLGYDTNTEVCGHGFRGMACAALIQSNLFQKDAVEKQMSHQERNEVRLAYTHQAEFLEERKAMLTWWSDFLDANKETAISPYDYTAHLLGDDIVQFRYAKLARQ